MCDDGLADFIDGWMCAQFAAIEPMRRCESCGLAVRDEYANAVRAVVCGPCRQQLGEAHPWLAELL
ncbi:hypothetical protein BH23ACT3_BH23ACT3_09440 [soil metagenome]